MSFRIWLSCALCASGSVTTAQAITKAPVVWVASIQGAVSFEPSGFTGSEGWVPAEVNHPIAPGDRISIVGNGRAELRSDNGKLVIHGDSTILFQRLDERAELFQLEEGNLDVDVDKAAVGRQFEVATGNLSLMFAGAGQFRIETGSDGATTNLAAQGGEIQAAFANQKAFLVEGGQSARVSGTDYALDGPVAIPDSHPGNDGGSVANNAYPSNQGKPTSEYSGYPGAGSAGNSSAALPSSSQPSYGTTGSYPTYGATAAYPGGAYPPDADPGADQLRNYGDWNQSPYGLAWYPRVAADWTPFTTGHWNWIDPWGWTWIDSNPWGFTPSHYGRWGRSAVGWYWVPGPPVYSPATVAWVNGPVGVGVSWFPLGPGEVVGSMRYVNRNYVTVVGYQAFVGAMPVAGARVRVGADFGLRNPVIGSVAITPTRASVLGNVVSASHPSLAVLNRTAFSRLQGGGSPMPFAQRQQVWAANPGRPISTTQLRTPAFGGTTGFRAPEQRPGTSTRFGQQPSQAYPAQRLPQPTQPTVQPAQPRTYTVRPAQPVVRQPAPAARRAPVPAPRAPAVSNAGKR